mmetsp:Transcript_5678/g.16564  ORF Transcript_5678/g.16564 Transcript_5678/m.16564 type:complete len:209 (+) Transcript_5678:491-1117(+)
MVRMEDSGGKVMEKTEYRLTKRGSTIALAPPGGAMADMDCMSLMCLSESSLRSYTKPLSNRSLRSAMGCCVPYVSTRGMLRSSTKMRRRLPAGGPNVSLVRFSMESSMAACTSRAEVRLEKLMVSDSVRSGDWFMMKSRTIVVFAVPESPTRRMGVWDPLTVHSRSQLVRTVSDVGTTIDENLPSAGALYSGTSCVHGTQRRSSTSKR